jgi:DNA polymerase III subunit gamma/tau
LLLIKLSGKQVPFLTLSAADRDRYEQSAQLYSQEQCLTILDFLLEAQNQIRFMPSGRVALEALLLRILRIHQRVPVEFLVKRLSELEEAIAKAPQQAVEKKSEPTPVPAKAAPKQETPPAPPLPMPPVKPAATMTVDPTPTARELGRKEPLPVPPKPVAPPPPATVPAPVELGARPTPEAKAEAMKKQSRYDTILHFAAVELEGSVQKKQIIN